MGPKKSIRDYGQVFDSVAEAYDAVRSGYPGSLVDVAVERGNLSPGSRVVEVGSGTGKLTELLAERGLVVDAVEPGENMIAAAQRRIGKNADVTFHRGRFEDVELPEQAFDALFSATAFHWIDPQIGWAKAASLLKPGGLLALLIHTGLREPETAHIDDELREVLRRYAPEVVARWRPQRNLDEFLAGVPERRDNASEVWDWLMSSGHELGVPEAAGLFTDVEVASHVRVVEETADELMALFRTTSLWFLVDEDRRADLEADDRAVIERHGGTLRTSIATLLMTAKRA